jgi:hypothetical protein
MQIKTSVAIAVKAANALRPGLFLDLRTPDRKENRCGDCRSGSAIDEKTI